MERPFSSGSLFRSILMVWRASWSPYYPHNVADFILYRNPYFSNVCKAENSAVLTADGSLAMDLGFVYFLAYRCPPHKLQHARLHKKIRNTSYITCRPDLYKKILTRTCNALIICTPPCTTLIGNGKGEVQFLCVDTGGSIRTDSQNATDFASISKLKE